MFCLSFIVTLPLVIFDKMKYRIISWLIIIVFSVGYIIHGNSFNIKYEVVRSLSDYNLGSSIYVSSFTDTNQGNVELIKFEDTYNIRLIGLKNSTYTFTITNEEGKKYDFEYYYDEK